MENPKRRQQLFLSSPSHVSGSCLDVEGASTTNGASASLWTNNTGLNQQWKLELLP
jgi:hypothetical protein